MRLQRLSNGQHIILDGTSPLGRGGEALIYAVPDAQNIAAKVYHTPSIERAHKLNVMITDPPNDPMAAQGHISIAWPVDLLCSTGNRDQIVGFLMPLITEMRPIFDFYNPSVRGEHCPLFDYRYLHVAAKNLCSAMYALHGRGYVIGDINESNIFAAQNALITLIDTDSFQVRDLSSGKLYRCTVGRPEFTPPELQGKAFSDIDREPFHDFFGLAVLIFQLLMEGTHPFAGIFKNRDEPPLCHESILEGYFPYSRGKSVPCSPVKYAPPFEILNPTLQDLFVRCFEDSHSNPHVRPDAREWHAALDSAEKSLITCFINKQHCYGGHLESCPWCERSAQLSGRDPFPAERSAQSTQRQQYTTPQGPRHTVVTTTTASVPPTRKKALIGKALGIVLVLFLLAIILFAVGRFIPPSLPSFQTLEGQRWVEASGQAGQINMEAVEEAMKKSRNVTEFEKRVNEIYTGNEMVLIEIKNEGSKQLVSGYIDLNNNLQIDYGADDKLFVFQRWQEGNRQRYSMRGYGVNSYYYHPYPYGTNLLATYLLVNALTRPIYMIPIYHTTRIQRQATLGYRTSYRQTPSYETQVAANMSFQSRMSSKHRTYKKANPSTNRTRWARKKGVDLKKAVEIAKGL